MNVFSADITTQTSNNTYTYIVQVQGYTNLWTTVYTGKVFVTAGQNHLDIELGDVFWNHKFDGEGFISPTINTDGDNYVMCSTTNTLSNYWHNNVRLVISDLNVTISKTVDFFNYNMFGYTSDSVSNGTVVLGMNYQPVCHIPSILPTGFSFRQLVWNGSFTKTVDNSTTTVQRSKLGVVEFSGGSEKYGLNGDTICKIDSCSKPYYLAWMTNCGTMQVQGFLKSTEFSVDYDNNNRIDMSNFEWSYNKTTRGKWKLKSGNLSDADYKAYGEMFNSPYLILIDTENNRMHYVNVKDSTYNEKKNKPGSKKIYFEINVESAEVKII